MSQSRLPWLLAVLGVLLLVRWLVPPSSSEAVPTLVGVAVRLPKAAPPIPAVGEVIAVAATPAGHDDDAEAVGNAFEVRGVAPILSPPPPAVVVAVPPSPAPVPTVTLDAPPPAPPPPPLQVIGTWDDGTPAVFIAGPQGAVLARVGTVLLAEYQVMAVTAQQVSLLHIASKRELSLPVPRVSTTP